MDFLSNFISGLGVALGYIAAVLIFLVLYWNFGQRLTARLLARWLAMMMESFSPVINSRPPSRSDELPGSSSRLTCTGCQASYVNLPQEWHICPVCGAQLVPPGVSQP